MGRGSAARSFRPDIRQARTPISGQSPSRLLVELFIEQELPRLLPPREIDVLEIGCGSGSMAARLARNGYCGTYVGVDIKDKFQRATSADFPFRTEFICCDAHAFTPEQPVDLMISVSALEHISQDAKLISKFPSFFKPGGVEVHFVPSGASLAVYLLHGYRQYTPAHLIEKFGESTEIMKLGGFASFLLHFFFITVPDLLVRHSLRKVMPGVYNAALRAALLLDRLIPVCPTAYVVIRRH